MEVISVHANAFPMAILTANSAYVKSNGEWLARSIVQGFFLAPIESLPEVSVTDVVRVLIL